MCVGEWEGRGCGWLSGRGDGREHVLRGWEESG